LEPDVSNLAVFGQNLRALCATKPSISSVCRDLGINRVQFNRYLAGTSFAKPDILVEICEYFEVDARIFVEELRTEHFLKHRAQSGQISNDVFYTSLLELKKHFGDFDFRLREDFIPDGFYVSWRRSFADPSKYCALLFLVKNMEGFAKYSLFDPRYNEYKQKFETRGQQKASGVIFNHPAGALMCDAVEALKNLATGLDLITPFDPSLGAYPGLTVHLKAEVAGNGRASKMLFQPIKNDLPSARYAARRSRRLLNEDEIPTPFLKQISSREV
jgi:hypothetical protein